MATRKSTKRVAASSSRTRERKSSRSKAKAVAEPVDPETCAHNWQISRPDSQISRGKCSKCGAEKDFLNYGEELRMPFGRRRRSS